MRPHYILFLLIIALAGCTADNEIEQIPIKGNLSGNYQSSGYVYNGINPHSFSMVKLATASSTPNTIYVDLATFGAQGYKVSLFADPVTYKAYVSPAPGATAATYTLYPELSSPFTARWSNSSLCRNIYDPFHRTFYLRIGMTMPVLGNVVVEEILAKQ